MPPVKPLKLVNAQLQVVRAKLRAGDWSELAEGLQAIRAMGYDGQPAVIDVAGLTPDEVDDAPWDDVLATFRAVGLRPIGVTGLEDDTQQAVLAQRLGLAKIAAADLGARMSASVRGDAHQTPAGSAHEVPARAVAMASADEGGPHADTGDTIAAHDGHAGDEPRAGASRDDERGTAAADEGAAAGAADADALAWHPPLLVKRHVRSGQQIYARNRDLVVLASVSPGAEVIADGNIACYGALHGRAIAGASGKADACIHALDFRPELVAVAGLYMTFESGPPDLPAGRIVQVRLDPDSDRLITESI